LFALAFLWIMPLFPAEPKLGPVFQQVTHFIPWEFPLLIIVPAFVTDLILQRTATWRPLFRAVIVGTAFLAVFVAVQWPFANFMMTPAARNWIFGSGYLDFLTPPRSLLGKFFYRADRGCVLAQHGIATLLAFHGVDRRTSARDKVRRGSARRSRCSW
jgi:hypothetical protein